MSIHNRGRRVCPSSTCEATTTELESKLCKWKLTYRCISELEGHGHLSSAASDSVAIRGFPHSPSRYRRVTKSESHGQLSSATSNPWFSTFSVKILSSPFLVCQALPFIPSSSLVLPSVLAATAPTSQSDPLRPAPSRNAQQVVTKGQHCGLLSLKVFQFGQVFVLGME